MLNLVAAPILKIQLLLHILNSCMLLLSSVLACCSYSQFCMLLLFSIPAALVVNYFSLYYSISAPLVLKFCGSCFVNPDVIIFKNPAALILWQNPAALVTNATWVCIHKATLHKKINFKTDSFLRLFTDIHLGTYWRLPVSFTSRLFYNTYSTIHIGGFYHSHLKLGGGGIRRYWKEQNWNDKYAIKVITNKY